MSHRSPTPRRAEWPWRLTLSAAHRATRRERGTILLMVVGVLALLAIIGVVYATIGQADRRSSATNLKNQRVNDQVEEVAAYLAGVIGDATNATYEEAFVGGSQARKRGYTYPWTDEHFLSMKNPGLNYATAALPGVNRPGDYTVFDPTGTNKDAWADAMNRADPREPSDPYLAVLEPEWLRLDASPPNLPPSFYKMRDWRHISNFAPSGNFVNLANLRRSNIGGGFGASPGFVQGNMSYGLTLVNPSTGMMQGPGPPQNLPGPLGATSNAARPSDWSNNQIYAFRPAVADGGFLPKEYQYAFNQWADADGDGFFDSRWFELTDMSGMFGTGNVTRQIVPSRGRVRLFCAARCIDSSAKINVNVAGDFRLGPWPTLNFLGQGPSGNTIPLSRDNALPPGISPGDIDLRRVLKLMDTNLFLENLGTVPAKLGYAGLPAPSATAPDRQETDYSGTSVPMSYNRANALTVGDAAYSALIDARRRGPTDLPSGSTAVLPSMHDSSAQERFQHYDSFGADPYSASASLAYGSGTGTLLDPRQRVLRSPFDMSDEFELASFFGVNDSDTLSRLEAALGGRDVNHQTFSPLRDNRPRSLEMAHRDELDGPVLATNTPASNETLLSVFSDIRHLLTPYNGSRPIKDEAIAPDVNADPASTDITGALRAIMNYTRFDRYPLATDPARTSTTLATQPTKNDHDDYQKAVKLIFRLYANALAPYTDTTNYPNLWELNPTDQRYANGLVYGGNPELALRMAAHMTANLIDAYDRNRTLDVLTTGRPSSLQVGVDRNEPTPVTLDLTGAPVVFGPIIGTNPPLARDKAYGGLNPTDTLKLNTPASIRLAPLRTNLRSSNTYLGQSGRVRVFGIEPQPFLTEYGTMAFYTDAPVPTPGTPGADQEWINSPPVGTMQQPITIFMQPDLSNSDFLGEVIAFQLNNPFDQDVVLYDKTATGLARFKFYIEYCARFYCFAQQDMSSVAIAGGAPTVLLKAGHTQTFYVLNPGSFKEMGERIAMVNMNLRASDQITPGGGWDQFAKDRVEHQLIAIGADNPMQITQVFPTTFNPVVPVSSPSYIAGQHYMDLFGQAAIPGTPLEHLDALLPPFHGDSERRVCQLWRVAQGKSSLYPSGIPGGPADDESSTATINDITNDILADRMHDPSNPATDPSGALWRVRTVTDGPEVPGTESGDEQSTDPLVINQNTGFSAIVWGAVRRPTDVRTAAGMAGGTLDPTGRPIRGVLPPWCLEARSDNKWITTGVTPSVSLNKTFLGIEGHGAIGDYAAGSPQRFQFLKEMLNPAVVPANTEIGKPCAQKGTIPGTENPFNSTTGGLNYDVVPRKYSEVAVEFHSVGEDNLGGQETNTTTPLRRSRNPAMFSRSGDFLLPLAIGPCFDPTREGLELMSASGTSHAATWCNNETATADREASWMTLSEALALSCGYYSPEDANDPLYEFGVHAVAVGTTPAHPPRVDRGHLVLDSYTPYLKIGTNALQPLGAGVPFALSIIDQFRAAPGVSSTPKNHSVAGAGLPTLVLAPEQQTRDFAYGGGTNDLTENSWQSLNLRQGFINVNTGPLSTLRALPMLAPETHPNSWLRLNGGDFNSTVPLDAAANYDLASTIKAYRDLSKEDVRAEAGPFTATIDFSPGAVTAPANAREVLTQKVDAGSVEFERTRRKARGIKSLGELAMVNRYDPASHALNVNSMFRFAEPDIVSNTLGVPRTAQRLSFKPQVVSSRFYNRLDTGTINKAGQIIAPPSVADPARPIFPLGGPELPNSYQDKLAIVNALTNTASVRSDVFTVYFLIHGYTPEDVDVDDAQPLVPSVAKRYVMVVDRSNVVAKGDKPRILMLKEVPIP